MILKILSALCALTLTASAATSTAWDVSGFNDLSKGRLSGLSLDADGSLRLGPALRWNANLDQPALWGMVASPNGEVYASTGHTGKVIRISPDGRSQLLWTAQQSEVFAICLDSRGTLYAGTSPNGGLYRIGADGKAQEIWHSSAKYIWALQPAPDGSLYIATGEQGRIFRYDGKGSTALYYETGQSNVTALAAGPNGHLYAGTDPNGILYDITGDPGRGMVLYDSTLPEIRSIAVAPNGTIYAAAMGGAVATRTGPAAAVPSAAGPVVATSPTVITVTEARNNGVPTDAEAPVRVPDPAKTATSSSSSSAATSTPVVEVTGVEKSAIYRILADRSVENVRSSKEDNVYDIALEENGLIFSTDDHGRVYRLLGGKVSLIAEPGTGEATRIAKAGSGFFVGLSSPARVVALASTGGSSGQYESQVHDATSVARWGHLQWHGTGLGVSFQTRSGSAARPDATWSKWSSPAGNSGAALITSPTARFIQFRAEWPAASNAQIDSVSVPYLPQNTSPAVHSISVTSIVGTNPAKSAGSSAAASSAYSVTVTDTGEAPAASSASSASQSVSRLQTTQTQISWQADDPDGDKLVYAVYFRPEDAAEWQLVRSRMFENTLLLDPDVFADGRYFFKVMASDTPSNAPEFAHQAELISSPVLIDNTPPTVIVGQPRRDGSTMDIEVEAHDKTSPLRLCEYSLDAGSWQPIESTDGITDSPDERFRLHLDKLRPGEHLLVFRVRDSANNAGLGKVVLR